MALGVFAYGSLVSPASTAETLGREVDPQPARLLGWRRRWSLGRDNMSAEKTFARAGGGELPRVCLGLNIEPASKGDEAPNGAVIELTEDELARLDVREVRYDRVDVTGAIEDLRDGIDQVTAYRAKPERFLAQTPPESVVIAAYLQAVEAAFEELGPGQLEAFRRTTGAPPAPVIEGVLVRDEIPAGNPRRW
jgi:hypothetical protein